MQDFATILAFAVLVEGITENIKSLFPEKSLIGAGMPVLISVVFSISFSVDIFAQLGFVSIIPFLGEIGTGFLVSRGSNYIHDLVDLLNHRKDIDYIEE